MKQAIIDIGSNSIRLTLYETDGSSFKTLFREKIMAGLAGYVSSPPPLSGIFSTQSRPSLSSDQRPAIPWKL